MLNKFHTFQWSQALQLLLLVIGLLFMAACTVQPPAQEPSVGAEPTATTPSEAPEENGGAGMGVAYVDSVEVQLLESFPVQAQILVSGNLSDGCTTIEEIRQERDGDVFTVTIVIDRPDDAVCTQALVPFTETVTLDVAGLSAGTYTVNVDGQSAEFNLPVDNVPSEEEPGEEPEEPSAQIPFACQNRDETQAPFVYTPGRFCLQYPSRFRVSSFSDPTSEGGILISGQPVDESIEPLLASLTAEVVGPAEGRTLQQVVDEALADFEGLNFSQQEAMLGGEPALLLEGLPGQWQRQGIYTIHEGTVYRIIVGPTDEELAEVAPDVEELWNTVLNSFTFYTDETAELFNACPQGANAYINVSAGFCMRYPENGSVLQPPSTAERAAFVSIHSRPMLPAPGEVEAFLLIEPFGVVEGQSLEDFVADIVGTPPADANATPQPALLGGVPALVVDDLPNRDSNRHLFVLHNGNAYHLNLFPSDADAYPQETAEAEAIWTTVLDSFTFFNQ